MLHQGLVILFICQLLLFVCQLYQKVRVAAALQFCYPVAALVLLYSQEVPYLAVSQGLMLVPLLYQWILKPSHRALSWFIVSQLLFNGFVFAGMFAWGDKLGTAQAPATVWLTLWVLALYLRQFGWPSSILLHALGQQDDVHTAEHYALMPVGLLLLVKMIPTLQSVMSAEVFVFVTVLMGIHLLYFALQLLGNRFFQMMPVLVWQIVMWQGCLALWADGTKDPAEVLGMTFGVSALAVTGLALTGSFLKLRFGTLDLRQHYGLFRHSPFMACAFLFFGLLACNFPGTLGFPFEELVTQSVSHVHIGFVALEIIANSLAAIGFFWAFCRLFTGVQKPGPLTFRARPFEAATLLALGIAAVALAWI